VKDMHPLPRVILAIGLILVGVASPAAAVAQEVSRIVVDDYVRQPHAGDAEWFYNRVGGNRGKLAPDNAAATIVWGRGTATVTINTGTWGGVWNSLRHNTSERSYEDPLNLDAVLPPQLLSAYQVRVTGLRFVILDGRGTFKGELKNAASGSTWERSMTLTGGGQIIEWNVPAGLGPRHELNWLVIGTPGDFVTVARVELMVAVPSLSVAQRAFLYSFAMLLDNMPVRGPNAGLTRDRANFPSGDFDNVSASGGLAAAVAMAWQLGFVSLQSARETVDLITNRLLALPTCHGLWPHFLKNGDIAPPGPGSEPTEWSSVDSIFALVAVIAARTALGMPTAQPEDALLAVDWTDLALPNGSLRHGYSYASSPSHCGAPLASYWWDFGTETWLANFGYASATERIAAMDARAQTLNGSGFIDELAWLIVPPPQRDRASIDWPAYRAAAAEVQINYYAARYPGHCYTTAGLFGLSAAEVPVPSAVAAAEILPALRRGRQRGAGERWRQRHDPAGRDSPLFGDDRAGSTERSHRAVGVAAVGEPDHAVDERRKPQSGQPDGLPGRVERCEGVLESAVADARLGRGRERRRQSPAHGGIRELRAEKRLCGHGRPAVHG
jgi:hypothetical protein